MIAVVKIGTSSITRDDGELDAAAMVKLCAEVAAARAAGHQVVLVEKAPSIGGIMAQLDKTYPTMDCSI